MKRFRNWLAQLGRVIRLRIAGRLVRSLGCTTVSGDALLAAAKKMAELASFIEKSGEVRRTSHAYEKLQTRVMEATQLLEGAVKLGDPTMQGQALIQTFMQARWASMSRTQQRKYQRAAAARQIGSLPPRQQAGVDPPAPPKATVGA